MNTLKISLSTDYDSEPSHLKVECFGEVIHDGYLTKDSILEHQTDRSDSYEIKITKTGKTKEIVDSKAKQEVTVRSINLNGIELKIKEFGSFSLNGNPYVDDQIVMTNQLNLNGTWTLELPRLDLAGAVIPDRLDKMRQEFSDSEIACFGCSQTYGAFLEQDQAWPSQLENITGKSVKNYGLKASNINEIIAMVEQYLQKFKTEIILLYLPHTFRRQITRGDEIVNTMLVDEENKKLILHGEEHSVAVLAGRFEVWLENITKHTKIYFGTYHKDEHDLYQKTPLRKFMFPFIDGENYPKASDGLHHGAEFNVDLAKIIEKFLKDS